MPRYLDLIDKCNYIDHAKGEHVPHYSFKAAVFDLDGVITKTAKVHSAAWKKAFDEYLRLREQRDNEPFKEFTGQDYLAHVDGKPRYKGVQNFLESRGIELPFGDPGDPPDKETCCGIGNRKNDAFREILKIEPAEVYDSTVERIKQLIEAGVKVAMASSSKNATLILQSLGMDSLFESMVDGIVSAQLGLKGKPEGDIFVTAAENVGGEPASSIVFEDATSGVAAGKNGGFGLVLGIAREDNIDELYANGADKVVTDLQDAPCEKLEEWFVEFSRKKQN
ncbi:MAG: HAD-IA family hydrolase [Chitinivibrionales bacterium]|nr:HAD-IA family hydrolase [Chitinivibrionales bacterium]